MKILKTRKPSIKEESINQCIEFIKQHYIQTDIQVIKATDLLNYNEYYHWDYESKCMLEFIESNGGELFKRDPNKDWHQTLGINRNNTLLKLPTMEQINNQ